MAHLTNEEKLRYARHIALPDFGEEAQERLKCGSVLVIGAGGLGSPVALYLAAAGVGRIGIADGDAVDVSNLQRQVIHSSADVGRSKVKSATEKMRALNPHVKIDGIDSFVTADNIESIVSGYDFIIDATDSFRIKFLINDTCVRLGKPYSHGAIWRYEGQTMTVLPDTPCYRCLFSSEPVAGPVAGPLGVVPGILGTLQATEAIKYLTGTGQLLTGTLLHFDALTMDFVKITVPRNPECICHHHHDQ